jgi:hypothetical protein
MFQKFGHLENVMGRFRYLTSRGSWQRISN